MIPTDSEIISALEEELNNLKGGDFRMVPIFPTAKAVEELKKIMKGKNDYEMMLWYTSFIDSISV